MNTTSTMSGPQQRAHCARGLKLPRPRTLSLAQRRRLHSAGSPRPVVFLNGEHTETAHPDGGSGPPPGPLDPPAALPGPPA